MKPTEYTPEIFEELDKKMNEVMDFCYRNRIPIFMTYAKEENGETAYVNNVITPINVDVLLSDDRITKYNASLNENLMIKFKRSSPTTYAGDLMDSFNE